MTSNRSLFRGVGWGWERCRQLETALSSKPEPGGLHIGTPCLHMVGRGAGKVEQAVSKRMPPGALHLQISMTG